MARYFSPSTARFYDEDIHGYRLIKPQPTPGQKASRTRSKVKPEPNPDCLIPADAFVVDEVSYTALLAAQEKGSAIVVGGNNRPQAVDPLTVPDPDSKLRLVHRRDRLLAATDWMMLPDSPLSDSQRAEAIAYRKALRDFDGEMPPMPAFMQEMGL